MIRKLIKKIIFFILEIIDVIFFKVFFLSKSNRKKIIVIAHDLNKAGAQVLLLNIIEKLLPKYEIFFISRGNGAMKSKYKKYVQVYSAMNNYVLNIYLKKLTNCGYKVAITNSVVSGDTLPYLKKYSIKVISFIHELPMLIKEGNYENRAKSIAAFSDTVIFPSQFVKLKFETISSLKNNVIVKPQGLYMNDNHMANKKKAKEILSSLYDIDEKSKMVLNVASGIKRKGFDLFLEIAIKSINNSKILFVWVGDYNKQILNDVLKKHKITSISNLILIGYIDNPNELVSFYDAADILLLTSREEPFGSIVLEAFNSNTPVLAFKNAGGYVDVVVDNYTGFLCEYCNIDEMQAKLIDVLNDEHKLKLIGDNCKEKLKNYNFKDYILMIDNIVEGYYM